MPSVAVLVEFDEELLKMKSALKRNINSTNKNPDYCYYLRPFSHVHSDEVYLTKVFEQLP